MRSLKPAAAQTGRAEQQEETSVHKSHQSSKHYSQARDLHKRLTNSSTRLAASFMPYRHTTTTPRRGRSAGKQSILELPKQILPFSLNRDAQSRARPNDALTRHAAAEPIRRPKLAFNYSKMSHFKQNRVVW